MAVSVTGPRAVNELGGPVIPGSDTLGVRQNSLMILRERRMNVIYLLCASTSAHIFCMLKNVNVFPCVNIDARRTSDQRQSNARHK